MKKSKVVAIIPARSGSKSIRDKNIAILGEYPLIAYSIVVAKLTNMIERVIISTDSPHYAKIANQYGAETPFLRPSSISGDTSTDRDFIVHAMKWMERNEGYIPEYWVHLRPTTPLRNPDHIDDAIEMLMKSQEATALRSAHIASESPFKWFRQNKDGYLTALTSEDTNLDKYNLPRQGYPDVFIPDGYVDIVRSSFVINSGYLHGDKVICYESPHCIEIDSQEELDVLAFYLKKNIDSSVWDHLKTFYKG